MDLHFAEPQWVHLLWVVLAYLVLAAWLDGRHDDALGRFMTRPLQARLVHRTRPVQRVLGLLFMALSGTALVIAMMRPQWGLNFVATPRVGAEIMVCLDVSRSMLAEDVAPNRLERAKAALRDLLEYLDGDDVGLIAFAGRASVLAPLTPDFGFLRLVLDQVGPGSVSRGGTRLEEPIRKAIAGFGASGDVSRSILLITDGEDHDSFPLAAAKVAAARGIRILAIGFGSESGSEIKMTDPKTGAQTLLHDASGKVVKSRLDGDLLRKLALATDGAYIPAGTGVLDLKSIYDKDIAGLTRGALDGGHRSVRNDAFQWAVLLGLVFLIAAVASTTHANRGGARRPRRAGRAAGWVLTGAIFLPWALLGARPVSAAVPAAANAPAASVPVEPAGNGSEGAPRQAPDEHPATAKREVEPKPAPAWRKLSPREIYNQGVEALGAARLDGAAERFEAARGRAKTDATLRYRATYDLGWTEVKRADGQLQKDPAAALAALHRAADWFRRAVALRPGRDDARKNLELVLRRALVLSDRLAQHDKRSVSQQVTALIGAQRRFLGALRATGTLTNRNPGKRGRRDLRALAARELEVMADARKLTRRAGSERDAIQSKPEKERAVKDLLRAARLDGLLSHVQAARQRMGQTRSQLRALQGTRAYARAAAALAELARARDQLLDPVQRLDALLADGTLVARLTGVKAGSNRPLAGKSTPAAPAWLSDEYLRQAQRSVRERTAELHAELAAGLQPAGPGSGKQTQPTRLTGRLRERLARAAPLVAGAGEAFQSAAAALTAGEPRQAMAPQRRALAKLAAARELFLDLRRLIDLTYEEERRIETGLADHGPRPRRELREMLPLLAELQGENLQRIGRVQEMIAERAAAARPPLTQGKAPATAGGPPSPEAEHRRLDLAAGFSQRAHAAMQEAASRLARNRKAAPVSPPPASAAGLDTLRKPVRAAIAALADLQRLFLSVVERLRDTARRQQALGDETEAVTALAPGRDPRRIRARLGPLEPRQEVLAKTAGAVEQALRAEADGAAHAAQGAKAETQGAAAAGAREAGGNDKAGGKSQAGGKTKAGTKVRAVDRLAHAAAEVGKARDLMEQSALGMRRATPAFDAIRGSQDRAVKDLRAAIALLAPPARKSPPPQPKPGKRGARGNPSPRPGHEQAKNRSEKPGIAQLLQGVRDREARRRARNAAAGRRHYEPVEKDW